MKARTSTDKRRFDSLEQEAFLGLWRTYDRLKALEDELFEQYELTPQQYNVLRLLKGAHPNALRTLDLAGRLVSRAPDITRMLDKLESRGFVERDRPADNRRVVEVRISPAGIALLRDLQEPVSRCHHQQLGHLSREELQSLVELLAAARTPHEEERSGWR